MTVDIPSAIGAVLTTFSLAVLVAAVTQYFEFKSHKKNTETNFKRVDDKFEAVDKHIEATDQRVTELHGGMSKVEALLGEIKQGQLDHNKNDADFFRRVEAKLETIDNNFKEIWRGESK